MEKYHGNTVGYWKRNAEENYSTTPISVLKYITVLEEQAEQLHKTNVSNSTVLEKPTMKKYGWHTQIGFDDEPSGWTYEGGEEAYYEALKKWEAQQ